MKPRTKNILLVIGFLLVLLVAYQFSIKKTLALKDNVEKKRTESLQFKDIPQRSATLDLQERYLDSVLDSNSMRNISIQNNLLEFLNIESQNGDVLIANFQEPHFVSENTLSTTSFAFSLKGSYEEIIEIIYKLEQEYNFGRIVHVDFEKKRDFRRRTNFLECRVIIENLL